MDFPENPEILFSNTCSNLPDTSATNVDRCSFSFSLKVGSNFSFTRSVPVTKSGWFHVRVAGNPRDRYPLDTGFAQAFTNPVWVIVDDQPVRSRPAANYGIRWVDKLHQMAEEWPGWRSQQERDHVFSQFDEARKIYERFAEEAKQ